MNVMFDIIIKVNMFLQKRLNPMINRSAIKEHQDLKFNRNIDLLL